MAKITPGIGFSSASGSVAGTTYARTRAGLTLRTVGRRREPSSQLAQLRAARFAKWTAAWRELTPAGRASWNAIAPDLAAHPGYVNPSSSGFHLFVSCNLNLLEISAGPQLAPPPLTAMPRINLTAAQIQLAAIPRTMNVMVGNSNPVNGTRVLAATRPLPASIANANSQTFRIIRTGMGPGTLNEIAFWETAWWPLFDELQGCYIWFRAWVISAGGLRSAHTQTRADIDAGFIP